MIEVVKKAEESEDIIMRVYECFNMRSDVTLTFDQEVIAARECDMLEKDESVISCEKNNVTFKIKPYEIKTIKIRLS